MLLNKETKQDLVELHKALVKEERREYGKALGRKLDQIELSYKQYTPPQMER